MPRPLPLLQSSPSSFNASAAQRPYNTKAVLPISYMVSRHVLFLKSSDPLPSSAIQSKAPLHSLAAEGSTTTRITHWGDLQSEYLFGALPDIPGMYERLGSYEPGGYCAVDIGDVLHTRYRVTDKLAYSHFSTTWLAFDEQTASYVAVKVGMARHARHHEEEIKILQELHTASELVNQGITISEILDHFTLIAPTGKNVCITFRVIQQDLDLWQDERRYFFQLRIARAIAARLALSVAFVHSQGVVHGDIRLTNTAFDLPSPLDQSISQNAPPPEVDFVDGAPLDPSCYPYVPNAFSEPLRIGHDPTALEVAEVQRLMLCGFDMAFRPSHETRVGADFWGPVFRSPPEVFFLPDLPRSYGLDIWMLGLTFWQLFISSYAFTNEVPDTLIREQVIKMGKENFPGAWVQSHPQLIDEAHPEARRLRSKRFEPESHPDARKFRLEGFELEANFIDQISYQLNMYIKPASGPGPDPSEERALFALFRGMFNVRPDDRFTIQQVLESEWMTKWALQTLYSAEAEDAAMHAKASSVDGKTTIEGLHGGRVAVHKKEHVMWPPWDELIEWVGGKSPARR